MAFWKEAGFFRKLSRTINQRKIKANVENLRFLIKARNLELSAPKIRKNGPNILCLESKMQRPDEILKKFQSLRKHLENFWV